MRCYWYLWLAMVTDIQTKPSIELSDDLFSEEMSLYVIFLVAAKWSWVSIAPYYGAPLLSSIGPLKVVHYWLIYARTQLQQHRLRLVANECPVESVMLRRHEKGHLLLLLLFLPYPVGSYYNAYNYYMINHICFEFNRPLLLGEGGVKDRRSRLYNVDWCFILPSI